MRAQTARTAAAALLLLAALTACSSSSDNTDSTPKRTASKAGTEGAGTGGDGTTTVRKLTFGKAATAVGSQYPVTGDPGGAPLEVTPTTIVYAKTAMGSTSVNGICAIITVKDRATGNTPATEAAPIEGAGWQGLTPDGQALDEGENEASSITPNGFTGGGMGKAGTWHWRTISVDLTAAQRGGTLAYTDGAGAVFQWKAPGQDQGPELAAVKEGMAGNY